MDHKYLLERMIKEQIEARGIKDPRVINALRKIKRHEFVREEDKQYAYDDSPLPIASGQTISQPFMVAYMTSLLEVDKDSRVLEIGTGSGYQAAVLASLAKEVYTIENIDSLSVAAEKKLKELGIRTCYFKIGDGTRGWPEKAPFDRMILTGAIPGIPEELEGQLNKDDGIIIAPVGPMPVQQIVKIRYKAGKKKSDTLISCMFVPLIGKNGFER